MMRVSLPEVSVIVTVSTPGGEATSLPEAITDGEVDDAPDWIVAIGNFFPLKHFAESFQDCFTPFVEAPAFDWASMGYVALWGVIGELGFAASQVEES